MSEGSSDEGSPGWEFVKNEDLVETSDGESVEVIGFSCPEESDTEDVVVQGEEVQVVDDVAVNVQTFDLVEVKKEVVPKNPSNVWESFVVIMAVTSVGLAVTAFLFHAEDVKLDSWTSESSAELSVALEELQKYQKVNIALNKEINQLKKVSVGFAWFNSGPMRLYPKRQHLPYHPVARFRGADSRPYYIYDTRPAYQEFEPPPATQDTYLPKMNAGELLALLFSGIKDENTAKMRGTLRFGIVKR